MKEFKIRASAVSQIMGSMGLTDLQNKALIELETRAINAGLD